MPLNADLETVVARGSIAEVRENLEKIRITARTAVRKDSRILVDDIGLMVRLAAYVGEPHNSVLTKFMFERDVPTLRDAQVKVLRKDRRNRKRRRESGS